MHIARIHLQGFRNFKDASISLAQKSLVIGSNDIGKSNLLFAIRLLLDKTLSLADLEPKESDFYAFEDTQTLQITLEFEAVHEECVISKLREYVGEDSKFCLQYKAYKATRKFELYAGRSFETLSPLANQSRFYLQHLNLKFIGSKRDLLN